MINKKVIDKKGQKYTLIQFVVLRDKIKAILETLDGRFVTDDYNNLTIVK